MSIINMQTIRYINLLDRASNVKTSKCYTYNNAIIFAVPKNLVSKAIGPDASNVRLIQEKLGKRVRIIEEPNGIGDILKFIQDIVYPIKFKAIDIKNKDVLVSAGNAQNKAALLGRNKRRFLEMQKIVNDFFNKEFRIV